MLEGKVALITGAGRGIGRAIALAYAEAGASVCCAARTVSEIEEAVASIQAVGGQALAVQTDVTRQDEVEQMVEKTVNHFGGLDILVINAGVNLANNQPVATSDPDEWRATIELNLIGAYYCARAAIPHLKARGAGKIITVGSGHGHRGLAENSAYGCSKAALWMFTRILAQELAEFNISVNELIPGPVQTAMNPFPLDHTPPEGSTEWFKRPEDVAPLALFLASQPATGPTAQSFSLMRRDN